MEGRLDCVEDVLISAYLSPSALHPEVAVFTIHRRGVNTSGAETSGAETFGFFSEEDQLHDVNDRLHQQLLWMVTGPRWEKLLSDFRKAYEVALVMLT